MYYKNVDIKDLESILKKGILSMDECKNNNWDDGRRANNPTNVVYLFKPKNRNCLVMYGLILLEIQEEINARHVGFCKNDYNVENYDEFIVDRVAPQEIKAIYAPLFLKDRISVMLTKDVASRITWVEFKAYVYTPDTAQAVKFGRFGSGYRECSTYEYSLMQKDSCNLSTNDFNYFRGFDKNKLICDYPILDYIF